MKNKLPELFSTNLKMECRKLTNFSNQRMGRSYDVDQVILTLIAYTSSWMVPGVDKVVKR